MRMCDRDDHNMHRPAGCVRAPPARSFFSQLFMRAAKMNRSLGGGSLTSLLLVPGRPATGVAKKVDMSKYQTLSEEQKAKIQVGDVVVCVPLWSLHFCA